MENWKQVWNSRKTNLSDENKDLKMVFEEMKRMDGYDFNGDTLKYTDYINQWQCMDRNLQFSYENKKYTSVFEVGCGSGPNLFLYNEFYPDYKVGGIDFSESLINFATKRVRSNDIKCCEAINLDINDKYDFVISLGAFPYFKDLNYAKEVLNKMYEKANHAIAIIGITNKESEVDYTNYRRKTIKNYDEKYKGLDKLFYDKKFFIDFAKEHNAEIKFSKYKLEKYWNYEFLFDCYLYKE